MSLKEINLDLWTITEEHREELESYNPDYQVSFNTNTFQTTLENICAYRLSDFWYKDFTGCFYMGILCFEPWYQLTDKGHNEESIWQLILNHHAVYDPEYNTLSFRFNSGSPINAWIRYYSNDGNVHSNVNTLFHTAAKYIFEKEEDLWTFEETAYCETCQAWIVPVQHFQWCECPDCESDLTEDDI